MKTQRLPLSFAYLAIVNAARSNRWHNGKNPWSISDWGVALAGEAGEVCNAIKKMRRIEDDIQNLNAADRQLNTVEEAKKKIAEELADVVMYCDLLAHQLGASLEDEIIRKFNEVSQRYDFPERL